MSRKLSYLIPAIAVFIVGVTASGIFFVKLQNEQEVNTLLELDRELLQLNERLDNALAHSHTSTHIIAYLFEQHVHSIGFDGIAKELINRFEYIDALQLVRDDTIIHTYPLEGNEVTIGYGIGNVPEHFREMEKARKRNELYFEGPFELFQGGTGFVGRLPIWKADTLWGYAASIVRYDTFLQAVGLDTNGTRPGYVFQLVKRDAMYGDAKLFDFDINAGHGLVKTSLHPLGDWEISVRKANGSPENNITEIFILGLIVSLLLSLLVGFLAAQPIKLKEQVEERTLYIQRSNEKLKEYNFRNAHIVRAPLANILALIPLLKKSSNDAERQELTTALEHAATSLDEALHEINEIVKDEPAPVMASSTASNHSG